MKWLADQYKKNPNQLYMNELTFGDVYEKVENVARRLSDLLQQETRVALVSDNSTDMVIVLFALLLLRKEVLLLNVRLTQKEMMEQIRGLDISYVLTSDRRSENILESLELDFLEDATVVAASKNQRSAPTLTGTLQYPIMGTTHHRPRLDEATPWSYQVLSFSAISALPSNPSILLDWSMDPKQIAVIMNTSATTGKFKSVPIRWRQIEAHVKASMQRLGVCEDDNWLIVLPIFHVSGLSIVMRSLYNGTRITILPKYDRDEVVRLITNNTITMVSLVPTILKELVPFIERHRLRMILLGGEFIPQPLIRSCVQKGLPIFKTYGMTETFSQNVTFSVLEHLDKADSVGQPLPFMKVHIVNPDEEGIGEIHVSGPMLMDGYLGKEPIGESFNTDDIGYVDEDGYLYILNRRKDIIISGGENIYPKEIEDVLYRLEEVVECAVVPVLDEVWGQVPALFIVTSLDEEQLRTYMEGRLAKYKVPTYIVKSNRLPRNASGKILRNQLHL